MLFCVGMKNILIKENKVIVNIVVNKEESLNLIYNIISQFEELAKLIPDWNKIERDKIMKEFNETVSKIIKVSV